MHTFAVVSLSGKQYIVKEGMELVVNRLSNDVSTEIDIPVLMTFDSEGKKVDLGAPELKSKVKAEIIEHMKGDKIRIAKFKSKVRYRRVTGFRESLTRIKITKI